MPRHPPVSLLTFSGIDAAGKSTQIGLLCDRLRQLGHPTAVHWIRGGYTPRLNSLKALARRVGAPAPGRTAAREAAFQRPWIRRGWLTLALLDLLIEIGVRVRVKCWLGWVVVCDRYLSDTLIDFRLNFPAEGIDRWWLWHLLARVAPRPDVSVLLLVPVAESVRRSDVKREPYRESVEILARRLALYWDLANDSGCCVLDGTRPVEELASAIAAASGLPAHSGAYQPAA
ncbi:MAG: hypothetical protein E6J50_09555 [Chloroflexi bacterium]|nr:MAG: hypothetical protein E6J50_09555 [Chloroflexota bacterium]